MLKIDIEDLIGNNHDLIENIPVDTIIIGKIKYLRIKYKYDQLNLYKLKCKTIYYSNQQGESMKNHILPRSLRKLNCDHHTNNTTHLPKLPPSLYKLDISRHDFCNTNEPNKIILPDSLAKFYLSNCNIDCNTLDEILPKYLIKLILNYNKLTKIPDNLPNSLEYLNCSYNKLISLPNHLPDSLQELNCVNNKLTSLPDILPNSLESLDCFYNKLKFLNNTKLPSSLKNLDLSCNKIKNIPLLPDNIKLNLIEEEDIDNISYNPTLKLDEDSEFKINGVLIDNQEKYDNYMKELYKFNMNKIKSARK